MNKVIEEGLKYGAQKMRPIVVVFLLTIIIVLFAACSNVPLQEIDGTSDPGGDSNMQLTSTPFPPGFPTPEPEKYAECIAQGGRWEMLGFGGPGCNLPTTDGGKVCTDSKDCESACLANLEETMMSDGGGFLIPDHNRIDKLNSSGDDLAGTCSSWVENFGCKVWVTNGRYLVMCVD